MKISFRPANERDPGPEEAADIFDKAMKKWGTESQFRMAQEEAAELIAEINRNLRQRTNNLDLAEEVADVLITTTQIAHILDQKHPGLVDRMIGHKLTRLKNLVISPK